MVVLVLYLNPFWQHLSFLNLTYADQATLSMPGSFFDTLALLGILLTDKVNNNKISQTFSTGFSTYQNGLLRAFFELKTGCLNKRTESLKMTTLEADMDFKNKLYSFNANAQTVLPNVE